MNRLFLAFLALLGLAVQIGPAEARIQAEGSREVGVVVLAQTEQVAVLRAGRVLPPAAHYGDDCEQRCVVPIMRRGVHRVPTVMLGIDRARE